MQTAVHVYNADQSFLTNIFGWRTMHWLRVIFDPPPPEANRFGFIACECADAYLPAALFGGGVFSFLGHLIAFAFLMSVVMGETSRGLIQIIIAWSVATLAGIAYSVSGYAQMYQLIVDPQRQAELHRVLLHLFAAVPIQFAFNAITFIIFPFLTIVGIKRLVHLGITGFEKRPTK